MKKTNRVAWGLAVALVLPTGVAARKVYPTDEGSRDPSFVAFRRHLIAAARRHDRRFIFSIVAPQIRWDLGEEHGRHGFIREWNSQPPGELERELIAVLSLGGQWERRKLFCAPYTATRLRDVSVDEDAGIILAKKVRLRARPDSMAPAVSVLSYDLVKVDYNHSVPPDSVHPKWVRITTPSGRSGYVPGQYVRGITDYEACFEKRRGRWWLTEFTCGE